MGKSDWGNQIRGIHSVHLIAREVEKLYAKEFLCVKCRIGGIRKLWHFVITIRNLQVEI